MPNQVRNAIQCFADVDVISTKGDAAFFPIYNNVEEKKTPGSRVGKTKVCYQEYTAILAETQIENTTTTQPPEVDKLRHLNR